MSGADMSDPTSTAVFRGQWWNVRTRCGACGHRFEPGEVRVPTTEPYDWCMNCLHAWGARKGEEARA